MGTKHDWMDVVYGRPDRPTRARDPDRSRRGGEITVRLMPPDLSLRPGATGARRARLTLVPSEPGLRWRLYLVAGAAAEEASAAAGAARGAAATPAVWWRLEPGTWQPFVPPRQQLAEGRGRVTLDVVLRLADEAAGPPDLQFIATPVE